MCFSLKAIFVLLYDLWFAFELTLLKGRMQTISRGLVQYQFA